MLPGLDHVLSEVLHRLPHDAGKQADAPLRLRFSQGTYDLASSAGAGVDPTALYFCRIRWVVERGLLWRRTSRIDRQMIEGQAVDYLAQQARHMVCE